MLNITKIGWVLAASLAAIPGFGGHVADAGVAAKKTTCPAAHTTVKIKKFSTSGAPGAIAMGPHGNVWFTIDRDMIGRLTPRGHVEYFDEGITPDPNSPAGLALPLGITKGPDGNLWFTESGAARIGRITPAGKITEFSAGITPPQIPGNAGQDAQPSSIVTGSDGNLWFTESFADRIGRITPDGTITEFGAGITPSPNQALPGPRSYAGAVPRGITKGPDGNVWFTEEEGNRVGRITPDGTITEFLVPLDPPTYLANGRDVFRSGVLDAITTGPDGNLWFAEQQGGPAIPGYDGFFGLGAIGRITPSGQVVQFSDGLSMSQYDAGSGVQPFGAGVSGIAKGPDGNLWFMEHKGVGRITPSGKVTEFPVKVVVNPPPHGLIAGPHGTLWFVEGDADAIGRITIGCSKSR